MGGCIGISNSLISGTEHRQLWQDRQIRWDQPKPLVGARSGEIIIETFENIEDTKGENGLGSLRLSNLRLVWTANHSTKLNISIGLGNVAYIHFNMTESPTFGRIRASHMMTQLGSSRFEFTFASRNDIAMSLFSALDNALQRYRATRMFRDLVLRDEHLMKNNEEAIIYHGETLLNRIFGCENLTTDEKFPGVMFITDKRVIWSSTRTPNINVSVPYIQFRAVGTRASNFGRALVIETTQITGGYILGFKFPSTSSLSEAQSLLTAQFNLRKDDPFFGPLDGVVQYLDDRLIIVRENQVSPICTESTNSRQSSPQQPHTARSTESTAGQITQESPNRPAVVSSNATTARTTTSVRRRNSDSRSPFRLLTSACLDIPVDNQIRRLSSRENSFTSSGHSLTLLSDSSSPELRNTSNRSVESNIGNGAYVHQGPFVLGEPLNLKNVDPLPIELQTGQAAVVYSAANQIANNQAELLLSISPSSKKYRAPRCVVCMATPTEAAFDPCGHLCSCTKCAAKLKNCPICRTEVQKTLRVYLQAS